MDRSKTLQDRSLEEITTILAGALRDKRCAIYLFGSRATGRNTPVSAFDIAVEAADDVDRELALAREQLEESNIPYVVDLADLQATSREFARKVRQEGFVIWRN